MGKEQFDFSEEKERVKFDSLPDDAKNEMIEFSQNEAAMIEDYLRDNKYYKEKSILDILEAKATISNDKESLQKQRQTVSDIMNSIDEKIKKRIYQLLASIEYGIKDGDDEVINAKEYEFRIIARVLNKKIVEHQTGVQHSPAGLIDDRYVSYIPNRMIELGDNKFLSYFPNQMRVVDKQGQ